MLKLAHIKILIVVLIRIFFGGGERKLYIGMIVLMILSAMSMAIPLMLDNSLQCCSVYKTCCYVFYIQISMNVTQTMEAVNRSVPTHKDLESVAADLGLC